MNCEYKTKECQWKNNHGEGNVGNLGVDGRMKTNVNE
jgi:hypothetical protein